MSKSTFQADFLGFIHRVGEPFSAARGQFIQAPFARTSLLYHIQQGAAHAFIDSLNGRQTIRLGYPGEQLSVLPGLFSGKSSAIGIESIRKCEGLSLSKPQLQRFINASASNAEGYTRMLEHFACELVVRELDLLEPSPQHRYQAVLARSPQVFNMFPYVTSPRIYV